MCFVVGIDRDNVENFLVYRLEKGKWNKMTERKWSSRWGHSCELLDDGTMVVIGGNNYIKSVDILDLGSLSWSEVNSKLNQSKQETRFVGFRVQNFLYLCSMTSPPFTRTLSLSLKLTQVLYTVFQPT